MYSLLFHKKCFLPSGVEEICKNYQKAVSNNYFLSQHFKDHINNQLTEDRSHTYLGQIIEKCLNSLKDEQREVFEVELGKDYHFFGMSGWFITKYCCRIPYNDKQDLVVAIRPQYKDGKIVGNMIVTAWMNSHDDNHYTLDKSKYCSQEKWESR